MRKISTDGSRAFPACNQSVLTSDLRVITDNVISLAHSDQELVVSVDSFFRELLVTYRVLFGQDEASWKACQRHCSRQTSDQWLDPLLSILCEKSWVTPRARDLY